MTSASKIARRRVDVGLCVAFVLAMLTLPGNWIEARAQTHELAADPAPATRANGSISGIVLDPSDAPIAGAQVTLRGTSSTERSTTTNREGQFQFSNVSPENYEIQVRREGFKMLKDQVEMGLRPTAPLHFTLELEELKQQIEVEQQEQVSSEPASNSDVIRLDGEVLRSLPVMDDDVVAALKQMLGPSQSRSGGTVLLVDGMPSSDLGVPASAIQEVTINQNPYSAEYSAPGQNRIEITTKPGTSQFHGSLNISARDYHLDARNAFSQVRSPESLSLFDGNVSGPIGKGKTTSFLFSMDRKQDNLAHSIYALLPSGILSGNFQNPEVSTYILAGIDRQIAAGNTFSVRYSYFNWSDLGADVGGLTLPEAATDTFASRHYIQVSDKAVITPNLVNDFYTRVTVSSASTRSEQSGSPSIVVLGAFIDGSGQTNVDQLHDYLQLNDSVSWSHGKQLIKAGINLPSWGWWSSNDRSNLDGTFQFSTLQAYLQNQPLSFTQQEGNGLVAFWEKQVGAFLQDEIRVSSNLSLAFGLRYDWQNYVSDAKNWAPRFSYAFAPGRSKRIVLRGGTGIFYQTTGAVAIADRLRFNGRGLRQIILSDTSYPNPFPAGIAAQTLPSSIVQFSPNLRLPYTLQFTASVETQLSKSTNLTASYVGTHGFDQFRSRDINAPLPPLYDQRPNPDIGTLRDIESTGRLSSNSLKLALRTKLGHSFTGIAQYSLERSYDDTSGIDSFPANQYDLSGEWARSDTDALHFLYFYGSFTAPRGLSVGTSLTVRSGLPYTITTGTDVFGTTFANARPLGAPRNSLQGPGSETLNLHVGKMFMLSAKRAGKEKKATRDGMSATLAVDAFNALNHVNFSQPVGDLSSPLFGQSVAAGPPRRLQLSLRFQF